MTHDALVLLLSEVFDDLASTGSIDGHWTFAPSDKARTGHILREDDWLTVRLSVPHTTEDGGGDALTALQHQTSLSGGVKCIINDPQPILRAEIPLGVGLDMGCPWISGQLRLVAAGLSGAAVPSKPSSFAAGDAEELAGLSSAAGWTPVAVNAAEIRIELACGDAYRVASLLPFGSELRLRVALEGSPSRTDGVGLDAAALFMSKASAALRFARAYAEVHEASVHMGFECVLFMPQVPEPLNAAMGSLLVACAQFACEAEILAQDPQVAAHYLELQRPHLVAVQSREFQPVTSVDPGHGSARAGSRVHLCR
jgi:hypothetical protein